MKLLATTLLVDLLRRREAARQIVLSMEEAGEWGATTEVNAFEVLLGAHRGGRPDSGKLANIAKLLDRLEVLPLDRAGAARAAEILSKLRAQGKDIGVLDVLVAGIALASGCNTIVTRDRGFGSIPGITVEAY